MERKQNGGASGVRVNLILLVQLHGLLHHDPGVKDLLHHAAKGEIGQS